MKEFVYKIIQGLGYRIYNKKKEEIVLRKCLAKYNVSRHQDLLFNSSTYILRLGRKFPDLKISDFQNGLQVCFNDLVLFIESKEEFLILNEIFVSEDYYFSLNGDCVVIDIGANVGFASIYFFQNENVKKIYAYEPVPDSFTIAKKNLKANKLLNKINIFNFGLGKSDRYEQFLFLKSNKGNSGIRGQLSPSYKHKNYAENRTVKLKKASSIINNVIKENENKKIAIKIDCEGAEYEIMEDLSVSLILSKIDVLIIEWHDHGPEKIIDYLKEYNFSIFLKNMGSISGMIYATRTE